MFVSWTDRSELDTNWSAKLLRLTREFNIHQVFANQTGDHARLFAHFSYCGFIRQFVSFDVTAGRQPATQFIVEMQQYLVLMDHDHSDRKVARNGFRRLEEGCHNQLLLSSYGAAEFPFCA